MSVRTMARILVFSVPALAWTGCELFREKGQPAGTTARATIEGRSNQQLTGQATFRDTPLGVSVLILVAGAPPGSHAVHIHETGDCSAPDASSAGGHFNPDGHQHGAPDAPQHHAGDFGNMVVAADGTGKLEFITKDIAVGESSHSVIGRAIIIHEKPDDMKTQPTGNAGGRIGCGVIVKVSS